MATELDAPLAALVLRDQAEDFLAREADLLDARRFRDWLALLTDDVKIWMPIARNVESGGSAAEYTAEDRDANWIDEGIETLRQRVAQLETGIHWAEQPPSRTTHLVANVRVTGTGSPPGSAPGDVGAVTALALRCRFVLYRNRNDDEQDLFIGKRNDHLRRVDGAWRLARREVFIDQGVLLSKNLSVFF